MQIFRISIFLAMLALCGTTLAQEPPAGLADANTRGKAFLPVYRRYIEAINTKGVDGLKDLTGSNFTLKWNKKSWMGAKAFQELKTFLPDPHKGDTILTSVKLRRLDFTGDQAIVQTEETGQYFFADRSAAEATAIWIWKQTWRKTPEGWQLILWEQGADKLPGPSVPPSYTVTWTPKSPKPTPLPSSPSGTGSGAPHP